MLALAPGGRTLSCLMTKAQVALFDLESGAWLRELYSEYERSIWDLANAQVFHPEGRVLITSWRLRALLRDWRYNEKPEAIEVQEGLQGAAIQAMAVSPDGQLLATGLSLLNHERPVPALSVWDLATRKPRWMAQEGDTVLAVAFSPDGRLLATAGWERPIRLRDRFQAVPHDLIRLFDPRTGERLRVLEGHRGIIETLAFSPDGIRLASGSWDGTVRIWDVASGRQMQLLPLDALSPLRRGERDLWVKNPWVKTVVYLPDGKTVACGASDGIVRLWDLATGRPVLRFERHEGDVWQAIWSPDGATIATAGEDRAIRLWDARTGGMLRSLTGHPGSIARLAFTPDGKSVIAACQSLEYSSASRDYRDDLHDSVYLWDVSTGRPARRIQLRASHRHVRFYRDMKLARDGQTLMFIGPQEVLLRSITSGESRFLRLTDDVDNLNSAPEIKDVTPDGRWLMTGFGLHDGATRQVVTRLEVQEHPLLQDPSRLGLDEKTLRLIEKNEGQLTRGHEQEMFSHDGRFVVRVYYEHKGDSPYRKMAGLVRLWDAATGKVAQTFAIEENGVKLAVALSPDSKRLAVCSPTTIRLFDVASGKLVRAINHGGGAPAFSPDGKKLVTSDGWTALVWDLEGR